MRSVLTAWLIGTTLAVAAPAAWAVPDRCLVNRRPATAEQVRVDVARSTWTEPDGARRVVDTAVVQMTGVRVGVGTALARAGFAVTRDAGTHQAWVSFAPSWDSSLAGLQGFSGDVIVGLTSPEGRFVHDTGLSLATGDAYEYILAVLGSAPELVQAAAFASTVPADFERPDVIQVLQAIRSRMGFDAGDGGGRLPGLDMTPAPRLRGAQLGDWQPWADPNFSGWSHVCEFPAFGGNVFRVNVQPFVGGEVLVPGRPLAERLAEHLRRLGAVIEWALLNQVHVILAFNHYAPWPSPERRWPDDGRSLWRDRSARDELVDAWRSIARTWRGRAGLLFQLMNEPHNTGREDYADMKAAWAVLQARLVAAIREVDRQRWVIVTPRWSDRNELFDFVLPTRDRVIVDIHAYAPHGFTNQPNAGTVDYPGVTRDHETDVPRLWNKAALAEVLQPAVDFQRRHGVRMMCGELGVSAQAADDSRRRWLADMLDLCESAGFDWSIWSYGAGNEFSWSFEQAPFRGDLTERMALNQFHLGSAPSGPLEARALRVTLRPVQADVGSIRQVFVAALFDGRWFFLTASGWQAWTGGDYPAYRSQALPAELALQVLDGGLDLSGLVGAQIFVGYGIDADDMLRHRRYGPAYTVN